MSPHLTQTFASKLKRVAWKITEYSSPEEKPLPFCFLAKEVC